MLSVIICTYNPNIVIFNEVLNAIKTQSYSLENWEMVIIDNNSTINTDFIDISWHPNSKIIIEKKQGLLNARSRGVLECKYDEIVFVDDDNVLEIDYLKNSSEILTTYPQIGVLGGKAIPSISSLDVSFWGLVGCRDLGNKVLISDKSTKNKYPSFAPIGTGMVIRKKVFLKYLSEIENDFFRKNLGRNGDKLTSGEDNDIVLTVLANNYKVGYFPQLVVKHIIPIKRTTKEYLSKMNFEQSYNWVKLLDFHKISPWTKIPKYTVPFRKLKAYFTYKAWSSEPNYIHWRGACGMYEGLAK